MSESSSPRVTGIGGVFFKSADPLKLRAWYHKHLGIPSGSDAYPGVEFLHADDIAGTSPAMTVWSPFTKDTAYFDVPEAQSPGQSFMVNYRVNDLEGLLAQLAKDGIRAVAETEVLEGIGKFSWIVDPEGTKLELWQPE